MYHAGEGFWQAFYVGLGVLLRFAGGFERSTLAMVGINWDLKTPIEAKRFLEKLPRLKFADVDQIKALSLLEYAEEVIADPPPAMRDQSKIREKIYEMQWFRIKDLWW